MLVGPPGSGKTKLVLNRVADGNAQLVVPTASMAEHLLHEMARGDSAVAPDAILPLAGYVAALTPGCREVSPALEILLLEQALERTGEFASVARYPGFQAGLLETVKELWSAGGTRGGALGRVIGEFEKLLAKAGAVHRAERLRLAAAATRSRKRGTILFDGFFNFTPAEIELLRGLAQTAEELVVTLPEAGADEARQALVAMGLRETRLERVWRPATPPVVVRFCPSETRNTCMMMSIPSMPTTTAIMISTRLKPRPDRFIGYRLNDITYSPFSTVDLRDRNVIVRCRFLRALPANRHRDEITRADGDLLPV